MHFSKICSMARSKHHILLYTESSSRSLLWPPCLLGPFPTPFPLCFGDFAPPGPFLPGLSARPPGLFNPGPSFRVLPPFPFGPMGLFWLTAPPFTAEPPFPNFLPPGPPTRDFWASFCCFPSASTWSHCRSTRASIY